MLPQTRLDEAVDAECYEDRPLHLTLDHQLMICQSSTTSFLQMLE